MQHIKMDKFEFMGMNKIKNLRTVGVNRQLAEYDEIKI